MPIYVVIENDLVANIIDAPSLEVAQEATGLICVSIPTDMRVFIGDQFIQDKPAKPVK